MSLTDDAPRFLTSGEAAARLGIHDKTLNRWSDSGRIQSIRTPGGHRRFRADVIDALADGQPVAGSPEERLARELVTALLRTMSAADLVDALQKVKPS